MALCAACIWKNNACISEDRSINAAQRRTKRLPPLYRRDPRQASGRAPGSAQGIGNRGQRGADKTPLVEAVRVARHHLSGQSISAACRCDRTLAVDVQQDRSVRPGMGLRLTPHGRLMLEETEEAPILDKRIAARLTKAFAESTGRGLLQLGAGEVGQALPPAFVWWRGFSAHYVGAVCLLSPGTADAAVVAGVPPPGEADL